MMQEHVLTKNRTAVKGSLHIFRLSDSRSAISASLKRDLFRWIDANCRQYRGKTWELLRSLVSRSDANAQCTPSHRELASNLNATERTIDRCLKRLVDDGLVKRDWRYAKNGRRTSNVYTLLFVNKVRCGTVDDADIDVNDVQNYDVNDVQADTHDTDDQPATNRHFVGGHYVDHKAQWAFHGRKDPVGGGGCRKPASLSAPWWPSGGAGQDWDGDDLAGFLARRLS